jgi:hypothetical protein
MSASRRLELLRYARYLYQQQDVPATPDTDIATA